MKANIKAGDHVWSIDEQAEVLVTMACMDNTFHIKIVGAQHAGNVPSDVLVPLAADAFPIGTKVMSTLGGGFTGIVTGYEVGNKVVCGKGKPKDRVRYAYNVQDLDYTPEEKFQVNHKYAGPLDVKYRCIQGDDRLMLLDDTTGIILIGDVSNIRPVAMKLKDISKERYQG